MDFATSIKTVLNKYADFSGRARRSEFWWWVLAVEVINIVLNVAQSNVGLLFSLAVLVPNLAVGARRLHDTGRSGWWQLIVFTIVGIVVLIVWFAQDSKPGANSHGPNPKEEGGYGEATGGVPGYGPPPTT